MPSRPLVLILTALAGLSLGWLLGRGGAGEYQASAAQANASSPSSKRSLSTSASDDTPRHNFAVFRSRVAHPAAEEEATAAIERMSSAELRTLLLEAPLIQWLEPSAEYHLQKLIANAAAKELVRREGSAAVDWSVSTGRKETRFVILLAFSALDPAAALPRVRDFNALFNSPSTGLGGSFDARARAAAALRSADDLLEVQKLFDNYTTDNIYEIAPDFDFATYFAKCPKPGEAGSLMESWAAADPDAAAKLVETQLNHGFPRDSLLTSAYRGYATLHGEDEAARWASAMFSRLPSNTRGEAIKGLCNDLSEARAAAIVKHLPEDHDRVEFAANALLIGHYERNAIAALQAMDHEVLRVKALTRGIKNASPHTWANPANRAAYIARIEGMMDQLAISPAAREQWRAAIPPEK